MKLNTYIFDMEATRVDSTVPSQHALIIQLQSLTELALRSAMYSVSILVGSQVHVLRRGWSEVKTLLVGQPYCRISLCRFYVILSAQ